MTTRPWLGCALAIVLLAGCSQEKFLSQFAKAEDQAFAKSCVDHLRSRDYAWLIANVDPSIAETVTPQVLGEMSGVFPDGEAKSITLVGAHRLNSPPGVMVSTVFEYDFETSWLLVDVATKQKDGRRTITSFRVNPEPASLAETNRLTLSGKSLVHWEFVVLAILDAVFVVYVFIRCIRAPKFGRKWLWLVFILVGYAQIALNWTTGQTWTQALAFSIPPVSFAAPSHGAWILGVYVPIGAILYLLRRHRTQPADVLPQEASPAAEPRAEVEP